MIYLVTRPTGKKAYSFYGRMIKDEGIESICAQLKISLPKKGKFPFLVSGLITIEEIELEERV